MSSESDSAAAAAKVEAECVDELLKRVSDEEWSLLGFRGESKRATLTRFAKARALDLEKALEMISVNVGWRTERKIDLIQTQLPEEVLGGVDPAAIHRYFGQFVLGFKDGVMVKLALCGHLDGAAVEALVDDDTFINYFVWQQERQLDMMTDYYALTGTDPVWKFITIGDTDGFGMRAFSAPSRRVARVLAPILSDSYPESVDLTIICNAPTVFSLAWRFVSNFLDEVTRSRTVVTSSPGGDEILAKVTPDLLPKRMGGTMEGSFTRDIPPNHCPFLLEHTDFGRRAIEASEPAAVRRMLLARHAYRKRIFERAGKEWPGPERGEVPMPPDEPSPAPTPTTSDNVDEQAKQAVSEPVSISDA